MINSILIGKTLYKVLSENLDEAIKVYPLVAENGTKYPFVTFKRDTVEPNDETKDGIYSDDVEFTITVVSETYNNSATIANEVRRIFSPRKLIGVDLVLRNTRMISIDEDFNDNAYVQTLRFRTEAKNND